MSTYGIQIYRLSSNRLKRGLLQGFEVAEHGVLRSTQEPHSVRRILLPGMDSAVAGTLWGRVALKEELAPECVLTIRAFASDSHNTIRGGQVVDLDQLLLDPDIAWEEKERLFLTNNGLGQIGSHDMLLNGQEGRWLWLWLEVEGDLPSALSDMRVYVPGDNFFPTMPEVYRQNNDFLRRYLSIFSTMFQDFQEELEGIPDILDVDTAPDQMLPVFASWLGLETDDSLFDADDLRKLLKAAPQLLARKGSRWAVESVVKLFVDEPIYVVENNLLSAEQRQNSSLYGDSPYDFSVMVGRRMEDGLRRRLQFLIDQFKPIRSRCRIVFLDDCSGLDNFTYMDLNGSVLQTGPGSLDDGQALTGMICLQ